MRKLFLIALVFLPLMGVAQEPAWVARDPSLHFLWTQIALKTDTSAVHASYIASLSASTAPVTNSSGALVSSSVTATELSYLHGVTSSIQSQLSSSGGGRRTPAYTNDVTKFLRSDSTWQVPPGGSGISVQSGSTTAAVAGTVVTFTTAFATSIDPTQGDYVVAIRAVNSDGTMATCRVTRTPTAMTLLPDFANTVVQWTATPRSGYPVGVTVAAAAGTAVSFGSTYSTVYDASGDYTVMVRATNSDGTSARCRVTRTTSSMTLLPDFDNTTVEWLITARTQ